MSHVMSRNKIVLVTGAGGPSGKAAIQALKERRFRVIATDMLPVEHQADAFFTVPPANDPGFLPQIDNLLSAQEASWLFPTVSEELVPLAEHAAALRQRGIAVYVGKPDAVTTCDDKWLTYECLTAGGVAAPLSVLGDSPVPQMTALGFPRVSKPRIGRGGRGVVVHDRPGTRPERDGDIWQQFLPGTEYDVLTVVHPGNAVPMATRVFEKTALREGRTGNATALREVSAPDVAALARAAVRAVGLTGPADMDIRRDAAGTPKVLEINARIGAHTLRAPEIFEAMIQLYLSGHLGE